MVRGTRFYQGLWAAVSTASLAAVSSAWAQGPSKVQRSPAIVKGAISPGDEDLLAPLPTRRAWHGPIAKIPEAATRARLIIATETFVLPGPGQRLRNGSPEAEAVFKKKFSRGDISCDLQTSMTLEAEGKPGNIRIKKLTGELALVEPPRIVPEFSPPHGDMTLVEVRFESGGLLASASCEKKHGSKKDPPHSPFTVADLARGLTGSDAGLNLVFDLAAPAKVDTQSAPESAPQTSESRELKEYKQSGLPESAAPAPAAPIESGEGSPSTAAPSPADAGL